MEPSSVAALTGVGQQFVNKVLADDPNTKLDDNTLVMALARQADKFPPDALYALYATMKQLGQNSIEIAGLSPTDAKARIAQILQSATLAAGAKVEVTKAKDTKTLDVLAQNIQTFLQTDYGVQGKRAESQIGLDTAARQGVTQGTSTWGWLGKLILGLERFMPGVLPTSWVEGAQRVVDDAEQYTSKAIKSGTIVESKPNTKLLTGLPTSHYDNLATTLASMYTGGNQDAVAKVSVKAAQQSQQGAEMAVAAGAMPTAKPTIPAKMTEGAGQSLDTNKLKNSFNKEVEKSEKGVIGRTWDSFVSFVTSPFSQNKSDVTGAPNAAAAGSTNRKPHGPAAQDYAPTPP